MEIWRSGLLVCVLAHHYQQAVLHCHGHADVDVPKLQHRVAIQPGVQVGELAQRQGGGFDDEVIDREFFAAALQQGVGLLAGVHHAVHVIFVGDVEMRGLLLGLRHAAPDGAAQLAERHALVSGRRAQRRHLDARHSGQGRAGLGTFYIALGDAPSRAGAADGLQIDTALGGHLARQWRSTDPLRQVTVPI